MKYLTLVLLLLTTVACEDGLCEPIEPPESMAGHTVTLYPYDGAPTSMGLAEFEYKHYIESPLTNRVHDEIHVVGVFSAEIDDEGNRETGRWLWGTGTLVLQLFDGPWAEEALFGDTITAPLTSEMWVDLKYCGPSQGFYTASSDSGPSMSGTFSDAWE